MSLAAVRAVARHELRLMRRDLVPLAVMVVVPVIIAGFIATLHEAVREETGSGALGGAQTAVPAMAVMSGCS
jgi:hypothetical protein